MSTAEVITGEIVATTDIALPDDAAVLDAVGDPAAYVLAALNRAKSWLITASTTDIPEVLEQKARAETFRTYIAQKELGKDAELIAAEFVRRCERSIALLIREGQEAGEIARRGQVGATGNGGSTRKDASLVLPSSIVPQSVSRSQMYGLADDVTDEEFEAAVEVSKEEKNLSRKNVLRNVGKAKVAERSRIPLGDRLDEIRTHAAAGNTSRQVATKMGVSEENLRLVARKNDIGFPADEISRGTRRVDSNRIVREAVSALEGIVIGLSHATVADLDPAESEAWATSLKSSIRDVNRFLKEMTQ